MDLRGERPASAIRTGGRKLQRAGARQRPEKEEGAASERGILSHREARRLYAVRGVLPGGLCLPQEQKAGDTLCHRARGACGTLPLAGEGNRVIWKGPAAFCCRNGISLRRRNLNHVQEMIPRMTADTGDQMLCGYCRSGRRFFAHGGPAKCRIDAKIARFREDVAALCAILRRN